MTNEFAARASRMSLRTFIATHKNLGTPDKLNKMYQKACKLASKTRLEAKSKANQTTLKTGRVLVHEGISVGNEINVVVDGKTALKTVANVGKVFECPKRKRNVRYAYFD